MDYTDFVVDRAQHMRPLEYDLSESYNGLVRYLNDMGILSNIPVGSVGPSEIITAYDALSTPLRSLILGGNSLQNGTPTPETPVTIQSVDNPVVTRIGGNLLPRTLYAVTFNGLDANGYYSKSTSFAWSYANSCARVRLPAGTYTASAKLSQKETSNYAEIRVFNNANTQLARTFLNAGTSATFTLTDETTIGICIKLYKEGNHAELQVQAGSAATKYQPYVGATTVTLPLILRGLPDGTRDTATYTYVRPSEREGWAWYEGSIERSTDQTTQASTDGITGTVGVDVLSTTGEIADGPTVIYKLPTPIAEIVPEIELPNALSPSFMLWGTADATPQLTAQYVRDISATINEMQEAIADL